MITITWDGERLLVGHLREAATRVFFIGNKVVHPKKISKSKEPAEPELQMRYVMETTYGYDTVHKGRIAWLPWFNYDNISARTITEQKAASNQFLCRIYNYLQNEDPDQEEQLGKMVSDESNGARAMEIFKAARACKLRLQGGSAPLFVPQSTASNDDTAPDDDTRLAGDPAPKCTTASFVSTTMCKQGSELALASPSTSSYDQDRKPFKHEITRTQTVSALQTTSGLAVVSGNHLNDFFSAPVNLENGQGTFKSITHIHKRTFQRIDGIEHETEATELLQQQGTIREAKRRCTTQPAALQARVTDASDDDDEHVEDE